MGGVAKLLISIQFVSVAKGVKTADAAPITWSVRIRGERVVM